MTTNTPNADYAPRWRRSTAPEHHGWTGHYETTDGRWRADKGPEGWVLRKRGQWRSAWATLAEAKQAAAQIDSSGADR